MNGTCVAACGYFWWVPLAIFGVMILVCLFMMKSGKMCCTGKKPE